MCFTQASGFSIILSMFAVGSTTYGQIQVEMEAKLIERADELSMELLHRRANLPSKWAALQEREVLHLSNIEQLESGITQITEFCAHHKQSGVTVQRLSESGHYDRGTDRTEALGMETRKYRKPGLSLYKANSKPWQIVPKIPFDGHPSTDPFNWCLGAYGSSQAGGLDEGHLDGIFERRVCFSAKEMRAGLQTRWGRPFADKKPAAVLNILFDKDMNLPISISWDFYPREWDPKNYAKLDHRTHSKTTVTWQEFKEAKVYLPVKIELTETGVLKREHLEVVNRIRWLLDDQVPDALFEDPMKHEIVEPRFPDYPKEEKRSR